MSLAIPIASAAVASIIVGIALRIVFCNLPPSMVSGTYVGCKGGWQEAILNRCDTGLHAVPQQPINTYTNLAYLAAGFFLAFEFATLPSFVIALALLYLCVGSAFYHATATSWGGNLDLSAMYATFTAVLAFAVSTVTGGGDAIVALVMFTAAVVFGYLLRWVIPGNVDPKIAIIGSLAYGFTTWGLIQHNLPWWNATLTWSVLAFAGAFTAWFLDKFAAFPLKRWGHGVWHLLTAAGIALLFHAIHVFH